MIRPIMTMRFFLRLPGEDATAADAGIVRDLVETLEAHRAGCVGMAANMIGERKRIIAVIDADGSVLAMLNPRIVDAAGEYAAEEGCLSLDGVRPAKRFRRIIVEYEALDKDAASLVPRRGSYSGPVAQAIQHEIDHTMGIVI